MPCSGSMEPIRIQLHIFALVQFVHIDANQRLEMHLSLRPFILSFKLQNRKYCAEFSLHHVAHTVPVLNIETLNN